MIIILFYLIKMKLIMNLLNTNKNINIGFEKVINTNYLFLNEGCDDMNISESYEKNEEIFTNIIKKDLIDYLEKKNISILSKLCYIKNSDYLFNQTICKYEYKPNIFSGKLKCDFDSFL